MKRYLVLALSLTVGLAAAITPAVAQDPVTIIVPFTPGGATDTTARFMEPKLAAALGQPVVIDNRPGATGAIGAGLVARAAPDGKTLLVASLGTFATNPFLQKNLSYDPLKDFDLLTVAVATPNVLVANPGFKANNVEELVAMMKENPETVTFANSGNGSSDHLTAALFFKATQTKGVHVSYKGGSPAHTDIVGGHVDVSFQNLGAIANYVKEGQMKALAQTGQTRHALLPNVPTLHELGYKDIVVSAWQGVAAPKGLSPEVKTKLNDGLKAALTDPEVVSKFNKLGFNVVNNSNEEFSQFLKNDMARWKQVIDSGKITVE